MKGLKGLMGFVLIGLMMASCTPTLIQTVVVTATTIPATTPTASVSRPSLTPSPSKPQPTVTRTTEPMVIPSATAIQMMVSQDCSGQSSNPPTKLEGPIVAGNWVVITRPDGSWFYETTANPVFFLNLDPGQHLIEVWRSPQAPNSTSPIPAFSNEDAEKLASIEFRVGCVAKP